MLTFHHFYTVLTYSRINVNRKPVQKACINPFKYKNNEECGIHLHEGGFGCNHVQCKKIKKQKKVCPSDSRSGPTKAVGPF